jgi:hypothetical protein
VRFQVIAKGEAQGMVSKFLGIAIGIALANRIGSSVPLALISFSGVTALHMYCNLKSYQSIQLRTLNPYRASNVLSPLHISTIITCCPYMVKTFVPVILYTFHLNFLLNKGN